MCCDRDPEGGQCKATGQYCDSSIGGDCCTSKNTGAESPRCKDNLAVTMTGADCFLELEMNLFAVMDHRGQYQLRVRLSHLLKSHSLSHCYYPPF